MTRNVRESEFDAMRKRAEAAERERDQLKNDWDAEHKHCVYMKNSANEIAREVEKLRIELAERNEEREELRAHCERLRGALQRIVDEAAHLAGFSESTERVVLGALNETPQAARAQSAEPAGMFGLTRDQALTIADELREAVDGMSDDDDPEAEHLMDLTFKNRIYGDEGIEEGPQLCVNLSEYPEEGVYPIDQTGNAEARKTRTQPPSAGVPARYAGVKMWVGNKEITKVLPEGGVNYERERGIALKFAAQSCLDQLAERPEPPEDA